MLCEIAATYSDVGCMNCSEGHQIAHSVVPCVASSLFHVLGKNVVSMANSVLYGFKGKRNANVNDDIHRRSQASYKNKS